MKPVVPLLVALFVVTLTAPSRSLAGQPECKWKGDKAEDYADLATRAWCSINGAK